MMENILLEKTDDTPKVVLDYDKGVIEFEGECYPENTYEFFEPIIKWIEEYFQTSGDKETTVNYKLTYFNSSTAQAIFDIFDIFDEHNHPNLHINWYITKGDRNAIKDFEEFKEEFEDLDIQLVEI